MKLPVYKPIISNSIGNIDLIDMCGMNLPENMSPDGKTPYTFLLVYIDHFTKKVNLSPLKPKYAQEVCNALLDIFVFCILTMVIQ